MFRVSDCGSALLAATLYFKASALYSGKWSVTSPKPTKGLSRAAFVLEGRASSCSPARQRSKLKLTPQTLSPVNPKAKSLVAFLETNLVLFCIKGRVPGSTEGTNMFPTPPTHRHQLKAAYSRAAGYNRNLMILAAATTA